MDIKLIALDMDGTLLNEDLAISNVNRDAIARAMAKGVQVVLSTGRSLDTCHAYAESLNLSSYLVTCNGGEIWTVDKQLVERHLLRPEQVKKMWELADRQGVNAWAITTDKIWRHTPPTDFFHHDWLKFGCDSEDPEALRAMIKELSYDDDLELANSLATNIEVNPKGVHKASGLQTVCEQLGLTMDHVLAIGDSLNDMKMIQQAGVGVAMANGQEAIQNAADDVTDTNDDHGVGKAIDKFVLMD